jgi:hypothetical protein
LHKFQVSSMEKNKERTMKKTGKDVIKGSESGNTKES